MLHRIYIFSVFLLSLLALPTIRDAFSRDPVVQSINESSTHVVYDDSLSQHWENWSWNSEIQFDLGESPHKGSRTIQWRSYNWGGLYLHVKNNESLNPELYESLEFSLKGAQDNHALTFILYDENNQPMGTARPLTDLGGAIPNGNWKSYSLPLTTINPDNKKIKGIVLQSTKGEDQRIFVDEVRFTPKQNKSNEVTQSASKLPIYTDTLDKNWENWSWDSTIVFNESFKVDSGTHSLAYTPHRPWAGLFLHAKQPVDTSSYKYLSFAVYASGNDQEFSLALLDAHNNTLQSPQPLSKLGNTLQHNEWTHYTIPLSTLGADKKQIGGIIIQESKGSTQPIIYIDTLSLTADTSTNLKSPTTPSLTPTLSLSPTITATPTITPTPQARTTTGNPFASRRLYVTTENNAKRTADEWRSQGRTSDADALSKISQNPTAMWAVGGDAYSRINEYVTQAYSANALPVIVAYNIPGRDCGQYSQGGSTYEGYKSWIQSIANAIGDRHAAVILEPDALGLDCLQNENTYSLLQYAVETLESKPNTSVYIEAATWVSADTMASRLLKAGIEKAQGFAINTSGYNTTNAMVNFGNTVSAKVGKNFVIDTSRNGNGPYDSSQHEPWCNPPDRALGPRPTAQTGHANVDAYLWIKVPGESDGTCRGGPSAGSWWAEYALGLSQRASY